MFNSFQIIIRNVKTCTAVPLNSKHHMKSVECALRTNECEYIYNGKNYFSSQRNCLKLLNVLLNPLNKFLWQWKIIFLHSNTNKETEAKFCFFFSEKKKRLEIPNIYRGHIFVLRKMFSF